MLTVGDVLKDKEERLSGSEKKKKVWTGTPPHRCNLCNEKIETRFVDGRTVHGPWAFMCEECHEGFGGGVGLGLGKGQLYEKQGDEWVKIGG